MRAVVEPSNAFSLSTPQVTTGLVHAICTLRRPPDTTAISDLESAHVVVSARQTQKGKRRLERGLNLINPGAPGIATGIISTDLMTDLKNSPIRKA